MTNCAFCGHDPFAHEPEIIPAWPPRDGAVVYGRLGRCRRSEQTGRGFRDCSCGGYTADPHPLVTDLLGFTARNAIDSAVFGRPTRGISRREKERILRGVPV